eukprot:6184975-Pleurochrysis_carterae.AAC.1
MGENVERREGQHRESEKMQRRGIVEKVGKVLCTHVSRSRDFRPLRMRADVKKHARFAAFAKSTTA